MDLTSQEVKEKINNGENFMLDCHALWCGPCKVMSPEYTKAAEILKQEIPNISLYKYDIDSDREFSAVLGIRSVPTIKIYKNGKEVHTQPGLMMSNQIVNLAKTYFS